MEEEFDIKEVQIAFDFKSFFSKVLAYWPLMLISLAIGLSISYYHNIRKLPIYSISNLISIKDDQNPFFTTNTSLTFNWGGTTDKVNTSLITLKSRSHNEKVVDALQFYLNVKKDGKYKKVDAYGKTPFEVRVDTSNFQMLNTEFVIEFKDSVHYTITAQLPPETKRRTFQVFDQTKEIERRKVSQLSFKEESQLGIPIDSEWINLTLFPVEKVQAKSKQVFYLSINAFNSTVKRYSRIRIDTESKGSSVIKMEMEGKNKNRLVDYLNASVNVFSRDMLERKNLFATKTIRFIDSSLQAQAQQLKDVEQELNDFKNANAIFDLNSEGNQINSRLNGLDLAKEAVNRELAYYQVLEDYLLSHTNYQELPAPSVAGINEGSIVQGVSQILQKAQERGKLEYTYKEGAPVFKDIDRQIDAIKRVLLENISSTRNLKTLELQRINNEIYKYESQIRKLPKEQQDLLKIERRYQLSQGTYNLFLSKRSEANLVKAANVSDVLVIDEAKDTGGGKIGPNTNLNYIIALILGFFYSFTIGLDKSAFKQ